MKLIDQNVDTAIVECGENIEKHDIRSAFQKEKLFDMILQLHSYQCNVM